MIGPMMAMFGGQVDAGSLMDGLNEKLDICKEIKADFEDPSKTTFVCVCIPEFLSLYETERLVQHLARVEIDCQFIVCNQVLDVEKNCKCKLCLARHKMQAKYLKNMDELYGDDFQLIKLPLLEEEVRGIEGLKQFGEMVVKGW